MLKKKSLSPPFFAILLLLVLPCISLAEESLTITTYYPSPYGSYNELRTYSNTYLAITSGKVGIGTTSPEAKLHLSGTADNAMIIDERDWNNKAMIYFREGGGTTYGGYVGYNGLADGLQFNTLNNSVEKLGIFITRDIGNVGIGTTTPGSYKLYVNGNVYVAGSGTYTGTWAVSDLRYKTNIETLPNPLNKLVKLRAVKYDWKNKEFPGKNFPEGRQIGIIAQELEKEFPELVITDKESYKAIAYDKLTAVLLEGMKAQQTQMQAQANKIDAQIDAQAVQIETLKQQIASLKTKNK